MVWSAGSRPSGGQTRMISTANWHTISESEHLVQFYETDDFLLGSVSEFIGTGLSAGDASIVIATKAHREGFEQRLKADGLNLDAARVQGTYISLDALETLSTFMVDGYPDPERFASVVGGIIEQAAQEQRRVRVSGEMVALLWMEGNRAAAIRLEELWNDLRNKIPRFSLLCAYAMHGFDGVTYGVQFTEICQQHSRIIPNEKLSVLISSDDLLRAITLLQQKANSLEAEIAERKATEEQLRISESRKDEFISMASHELKTPITSLKGFLGLLQRRLTTRGDETALHYLARMDTQVNKLTRLINDLLNLSRIQTGQIDYQAERFEMDALVQEIVENVQGTTQSHHLILEEQAQAEIFGDRDRIGQVLINLLNNAIKYSPRADTVLVRVAKDRGQVIVSVQDFGIGIAKEHQHKIFERFYQVNDPQEKTYPGLGIGLFISCEIVRRHGGQLWVESKKDEGATFHCSLPLL